MLITIPGVLTTEEVIQFRKILDQTEWQNGINTAGSIARHVKQNQQLDDSSESAIALGNHLLRVLANNPTFISAALPDRIYPPKFNRYSDRGNYGAHIDSSVMQIPGTHISLRTDLSATLFLAEPDEYTGGELSIDTEYGTQQVKLPAGDMVLYPSTSLHQVTPVIEGVRVASFFWIQSMVRDMQARETLYTLDQSVQKLTHELGPSHSEVVRLSGIYHNLLRQWATPS